MMEFLGRAGLVTCAMSAAGCAMGPGLQGMTPGTTLAQAREALGPPTARYAREGGGERIEYARGPYGKTTYMLDFDAQGRLLGWQQVLTEANFGGVQVGERSEEVLFAIGHPSDLRRLPRQQHMLWSYRYESPFCSWFQVSVDRQGRVAETGYGPDPACEINIDHDSK